GYYGQAFEVPMTIEIEALERDGFDRLIALFDEEHKRLFTFNMDVEHELVNLRAAAVGRALDVTAEEIARGDGNPGGAKLRDHDIWMDGRVQTAVIYDRARLRAGDRFGGPAIIVEMDSTTLVDSGHVAD